MKETAIINKHNMSIWRAIIIAAMVIGVVGVVGGMVWSAEKGKSKGADANQVIAMATSAKITIEGAAKTALENIPGKVIEAELEKRRDKTVWKAKS
jgi:cytochrome oxidase Cu insertion factor (SCO1/SenC/PrrC family)